MAYAYFHPDFSLESEWEDQDSPRAWVAGSERVGVCVPADDYDYDEVEELIVMLEQARDYSKWAPKPDINQGEFGFMAEQKLD